MDSDTKNDRTCGNGLAERAALPANLARLTAAMAEVLSLHQRSLDLTDSNAKRELHAYVQLEEQFRMISALLKATAANMAGYRDLPIARHDIRSLAGIENAGIFAGLIRAERESLDLFHDVIEGDEKILDEMRRPVSPATSGRM